MTQPAATDASQLLQSEASAATATTATQLARTRLGTLAASVGVATLVITLVPAVLSPAHAAEELHRPLVFLALAGLLLDAAMIFLAWASSWSSPRVLGWGFAYQLARSATLVLCPLAPSGLPVLTLATPLILSCAVLLPQAGRIKRWTTIGAAAWSPLALGLSMVLLEEGAAWIDLLQGSVVALLTLFLARLTARALLHLKHDRPRSVGAYNLVEKIGQGGMGEVWRGEHRFLSRPAAIKLIPPRDKDNPRAREQTLRRFQREAQVTAQLTSPHTVEVYDYGTTDEGAYFYVMEHLDGFDLQQLVESFGPVPSARALYLLKQICDSMGEAHDAGLIHRDLKPSNLFIVRRGLRSDFVKVLDFGLVGLGRPLRSDTFDGKLTAAGMMTGTPAYMSPEMVLGDELDHRADLYSLGCVLFFLVTGRVLFPNVTPINMALAHAHDAPPRPSEVTDLPISVDLERIILLLLEKDPNKRPQSAHQLARLLERLDVGGDWTDSDADDWWHEFKPSSVLSLHDAVRRDSPAADEA